VATKAGVIALTKSWALDLQDRGIRVNAISPVAQTLMMSTAAGEPREFPSPDTVAPLSSWLLSDRARHFTGQVVVATSYRRGRGSELLDPLTASGQVTVEPTDLTSRDAVRDLFAKYRPAIAAATLLALYHCAQLDCFFSVDVYLGATSVVLPGPDPATVLAAIERERATKLFAPPTVWISLLRHPSFDATDLSSLRKGYYGASAMPVEVLRELQRRLPDVRFWNFYGQTEMAPVATILGPEEQLAYAGSAGRPALNVETRVVDDEDNEVPPGQAGEIVHRSPQAALGYYRDEEKTAAAFRNGWFHSGDLGVLDGNGYLSVVDRKKDMIKTGGENVASREVEEALYQLDGIAEVAVFGIDHPHWIEAVTAVIVPKPGAALTAEDVSAHARGVLAGYKRPKYVVFAEDLPRNLSGKILKKELRVTYADLSREP
jgi:fatty-acyl-CoA synthase